MALLFGDRTYCQMSQFHDNSTHIPCKRAGQSTKSNVISNASASPWLSNFIVF